MPVKKKPSRRKTSAARKPAQARPAASRPARKRTAATRRTEAAPAAPRPSAASPAEQLARKIIEMTLDPSRLDLAQIYARECRSLEPGREPIRGIGAIEAKFRRFDSLVRSQSWSARHTWIDGDTICIEWEGELELANGRQVRLAEVAVHETRDGKIVEERFYYDPALLGPAAQPAAPPSSPSSGSLIDPIDL
jgi:hypothetical protein